MSPTFILYLFVISNVDIFLNKPDQTLQGLTYQKVYMLYYGLKEILFTFHGHYNKFQRLIT